MMKSFAKALAVSVFVGGMGLMAGGLGSAPAFADPDDAAQGEPMNDDAAEDGGDEGPGWDAPDGPPQQIGMLDDGDQQNYENYLNGVPAGPSGPLPARAPGYGGGYAPAGGAAGARRALPLPFVAPKGSTCGQKLATSVGGTMDNIVGMGTGPVLGFVGHNVLGPLTGNLVGGALVHVC